MRDEDKILNTMDFLAVFLTLSLAACGISAQKTNSQQAKTEKSNSSASDGQVEAEPKEELLHQNRLSSMTQKTALIWPFN